MSSGRAMSVDFERRRHARFSVELPVEYWQIDKSRSRPARTIDISEGGVLLCLSQPLDVGQNLGLILFIDSGHDLDAVEALAQVEVVWKDIHPAKNGDYQVGVKFMDISSEDMAKLKSFLNTLK